MRERIKNFGLEGDKVSLTRECLTRVATSRWSKGVALALSVGVGSVVAAEYIPAPVVLALLGVGAFSSALFYALEPREILHLREKLIYRDLYY